MTETETETQTNKEYRASHPIPANETAEAKTARELVEKNEKAGQPTNQPVDQFGR